MSWQSNIRFPNASATYSSAQQTKQFDIYYMCTKSTWLGNHETPQIIATNQPWQRLAFFIFHISEYATIIVIIIFIIVI
jgi:hypothetical protein